MQRMCEIRNEKLDAQENEESCPITVELPQKAFKQLAENAYCLGYECVESYVQSILGRWFG